MPPTVRSPMVIRKDLSATVGSSSTRCAASASIDAGQVDRRQAARATWATSRVHLRRLAEQDVHRHVDRRCCHAAGRSLAAGAPRWPCRRRRTGSARARTCAANSGQAVRRDRQHIALLRFVAPDFLRRHAAFFQRHLAQVEDRAALGVVGDLREGVRQAAGADVVDREDRIVARPAASSALMTSCARRSISGLPRWTESKSRSAVLVPVAIDDAALPPRPMRMPGPPSWISRLPTGMSFLCVCWPEMLPMPPAIMIGL